MKSFGRRGGGNTARIRLVSYNQCIDKAPTGIRTHYPEKNPGMVKNTTSGRLISDNQYIENARIGIELTTSRNQITRPFLPVVA